MSVEAFQVIQRFFGSGQTMLIEYVELSNKNWEPSVIGIAPLDAPEDAERWRLTYFYYGPDHHHVIKSRTIEEQKKWSERAMFA